jgi:histidine decarboxylase
LLNVKEIEYAVARYYAKLWGAPLRNIDVDNDPHTKQIQKDDVYWGYVLSMGSSEGNIMASWMGRDYLGGKYLILDKEKSKVAPRNFKISKNEKGEKHFDELKETVYFTSTAAHYSVVKAAVLMNLSSFSHYGNDHYADAEIPGVKKKNEPFPDMVPVYSDMDGRVDPDKLAALVEFFASKHHAVMITLNYGTTFTGAFDEVELCVSKLKPIFDKYHLNEVVREIVDPTTKEKSLDKRTGYWIHVDGAYGGAYLPYIAKHFQSKPEELVDTVITEKG